MVTLHTDKFNTLWTEAGKMLGLFFLLLLAIKLYTQQTESNSFSMCDIACVNTDHGLSRR